NQIEGDIVKSVAKAFPRRYVGNIPVADGTITVRIYDDQPFDRQIVIPPVIFRGKTSVRGSSGANGSESYTISYCRLTVRKNGTEIYSGAADDSSVAYSDIIDMPAGRGHMTLEFSVSSTIPEFGGKTSVSNLLVLVMKKSTAGITIS
ncbi:TPA: hypothetical protein JZG68_004849, partial [Escherichia coli]|nr:hypothetical protein [Escherichia coli]